jgi:RecB family exonuclease
VVPADMPDRRWFVSRDREEELIGVARRLQADRRAGKANGVDPVPLDRVAIVYKRPLPYVYLARDVFGGAGIPYQTTDTFPLAAEPFAAALDLILKCVASSFTRDSLVALLRSPHFQFHDDNGPIGRSAVSELDRALSDERYLGGIDRLTWLSSNVTLPAHAVPALDAATGLATELADLQTPAPASIQIERLLSFLRTHMVELAAEDGPAEASAASRTSDGATDRAIGARERRVRAAILDTLERLAEARRRHDDAPLGVEGLASAVRRWIEEQTVALDSSPSDGLQLVDEQAVRFGDFEDVVLVGLVEGEWPARPVRSIFYPPSLLRALGWPSERDWRAAAEARFLDLLGTPSGRVWLSTITLDDETLVEPSSLLDDVQRVVLATTARDASPAVRTSLEEALSLDPVVMTVLEPEARDWAELRLARTPRADPAFHGQAGPPANRAWSVSALETFLQCPFKFFAQHLLSIKEEPDDEEVMEPRTQGEFVHSVFQAFFETWQRRGHGAVVPENLDEARAVFEEVVESSLGSLSETEAALERTTLLGSPAAAGLGDAVLRMEAERLVGVVGRLLEHRLEGEFVFQTSLGHRHIRLKGKADRVDLLADGTFRLIDYKLGRPPHKTRALQLPIYSICAQQSLRGYLGRDWTVGEAAYIAFKGPRRVVPLFSPGDHERVLSDAQERLVTAVDAIEAGKFPPRPTDVFFCETCTYAAVCRKDYVDDV